MLETLFFYYTMDNYMSVSSRVTYTIHGDVNVQDIYSETLHLVTLGLPEVCFASLVLSLYVQLPRNERSAKMYLGGLTSMVEERYNFVEE